MPEEPRMLTHQQALSFYNHPGARQDWQGVYDAPATRDLIAHASCEAAQAAYEFGCGTGAFAEQILLHSLPARSMYLAVDNSTTMVHLARSRLECLGAHMMVRQTDGSLQSSERPGSCARLRLTRGTPPGMLGHLGLDTSPCARTPTRGWLSAPRTVRPVARHELSH